MHFGVEAWKSFLEKEQDIDSLSASPMCNENQINSRYFSELIDVVGCMAFLDDGHAHDVLLGPVIVCCLVQSPGEL